MTAGSGVVPVNFTMFVTLHVTDPRIAKRIFIKFIIDGFSKAYRCITVLSKITQQHRMLYTEPLSLSVRVTRMTPKTFFGAKKYFGKTL